MDGVSTVVYEDAAFQKGRAGVVFHRLVGILMGECFKRNINIVKIPVPTIKKTFTGNHQASKEDMIMRAAELGVDVEVHDEADAIAIMYTYLCKYIWGVEDE